MLERSTHLIIKTAEGRCRCSPHGLPKHWHQEWKVLQDSKQERMMNGHILRWGKRRTWERRRECLVPWSELFINEWRGGRQSPTDSIHKSEVSWKVFPAQTESLIGQETHKGAARGCKTTTNGPATYLINKVLYTQPRPSLALLPGAAFLLMTLSSDEENGTSTGREGGTGWGNREFCFFGLDPRHWMGWILFVLVNQTWWSFILLIHLWV